MSLIEALVKIAAPHNCLVCDTEGNLVCEFCKLSNFLEVPSRCYSCFRATENSEVCSKCRRKSPLKHVWVHTDYDGIARQLIHSYKFNHSREAADTMANLMHKTLPLLDKVIVVPVPTATARIRQRGFDHTKLLTKKLAEQLKLPHYQALQKLGQTKQVGNKRATRRTQLTGAFRFTKALTDQRILLVDDVVTTGATLEEAARTLKLAGAKTVDAVVFAQKL